MNANTHIRRIAWLAPALLAGSLVAGAAFAQVEPADPADPPDPPMMRGAARLNLSTDQRREMRKIGIDRALANADTRNALQKARLELAKIMTDEKPDAAALDRKTAEIGQLEGKLLRARIDTAMRMRAVLTPEQRDKVGPGMWRGMMRDGGGPRGHRGMRRFRMSELAPLDDSREM